MRVRPAEVHPKEHLGPVGRFRAPGAGADRQDRRAGVVRPGEQELGSRGPEARLEPDRLRIELGLELGVAGFVDELDEGEELIRPIQQALPEVDLGA
jgi:hypothetical protein